MIYLKTYAAMFFQISVLYDIENQQHFMQFTL